MANVSMDPAKQPGHEHAGPFDAGYLPVDDIHKLHYEQYGKRDGKPGRSNAKSLAALFALNS